MYAWLLVVLKHNATNECGCCCLFGLIIKKHGFLPKLCWTCLIERNEYATNEFRRDLTIIVFVFVVVVVVRCFAYFSHPHLLHL